MRFQGPGVSGTERGRELGVWVLEGVTESLRGEVETSDQPEKTFGRSVLFGFEFVEDERLKRGGVAGGSELAVTDFLGGRDVSMMF